MRIFFNGLVLGIILGVLGFWWAEKNKASRDEAQQRYEETITNTFAKVSEIASNISDTVGTKLEALDLRGDQIRDEIRRTGEVVRRKAMDIGDQAADAVSDTRATAEIKAKYAADPVLSVWKISVACSHGHVTLTGTVSSVNDIGRAVALALEAGGVRDVTSTLQVKAAQ